MKPPLPLQTNMLVKLQPKDKTCFNTDLNPKAKEVPKCISERRLKTTVMRGSHEDSYLRTTYK